MLITLLRCCINSSISEHKSGVCVCVLLTHTKFMITTHTWRCAEACLKCVSASCSVVYVVGSLTCAFMPVPVLTADKPQTGLGSTGPTQCFAGSASRTVSRYKHTRHTFECVCCSTLLQDVNVIFAAACSLSKCVHFSKSLCQAKDARFSSHQ